MPVLIDGNNLLFAALDADPERPPSRSVLCLRLGQWARRTGEKVTVVFDGPTPPDGIARQTSAPAVDVAYSESVTADEVLAEMIEKDSAARRLLVVSSDREVARAARRRKARSIRSDAFWAALLRELARPTPRRIEPREKTEGLSAGDEADRWLRELGLDPDRTTR